MTGGSGYSGSTRTRRPAGAGHVGDPRARGLRLEELRGLSEKRTERLTGGHPGTAGLGGKKGRGFCAKRPAAPADADGRGAAGGERLAVFRRRWRRLRWEKCIAPKTKSAEG